MNARRDLLPIPLVLLLVPAAAITMNARSQGGVDKSLFISVLDEAGKPVKDIVADDILIREDGVDRQVVSVKPARQPISVAVLVDTAQGTRVTDVGLDRLAVLKNLKRLELQRAKVTAAGVAKLQQSLPKCKIEWAGGTVAPKP